MPNGSKIDILKLQKLVEKNHTKLVSLEKIKGPTRSKKTGFSKKRYERADVSHPLIVSKDMFLLDGRHRYFKLLDLGAEQAHVKTATDADIKAAETSDI